MCTHGVLQGDSVWVDLLNSAYRPGSFAGMEPSSGMCMALGGNYPPVAQMRNCSEALPALVTGECRPNAPPPPCELPSRTLFILFIPAHSARRRLAAFCAQARLYLRFTSR